MQQRLVMVLDRLAEDHACYGLGKFSASDSCNSHHRSLRFFVLLALLCFSVPQNVIALSEEEIIAISAMQDCWPQLGMKYPAWNGNASTACNLPVWGGIYCGGSENILSMDLSALGLDGTIPSQLGNLTSLQYLYLYNNQLNGTIPPQLANLNSLRELYLENNQLDGTIPPLLGNMTSLQQLHLNGNQLNGTIPPQLGNLPNIQQLYLNGNQLSGTIPPQLGNLTSLNYLSLNDNHLNGTIPPQLGNLTSLLYLYLFNNQLNGTIPPQLANLNSLQQLFLSSNQLDGTVPTELGNLTPLVKLWMNYNQLSGTIPPQLANLTSLQELSLYNNRLSGPIPPQLGNMTPLQYLYLHNNQLIGTIPPQLGNLTQLQELNLNGNKLSGAFPMELLQLPSLATLDLSFNELSLCPPPNSTNFTIPSNCYLINQSHAYCDPACSAFYNSLTCAVNFEVCTIPATPASPSFSCPSQTPPGPSFSCINGVWSSVGNVSGVSILISSPTTIEGDLELSNTLTFVGLDGSLSVDGCVNIQGIEIVLSDEDVEMIKKSSKQKQSLELLKQGKTTGCATLESIPLSVKHPKSCKKVSVSRDPSTSTHSSISVLFKVNSTNCHLWWIIFLSIIGGIVVIILVFVLLATFNTRVKEKVRPFWLPNTQMQGAYRYADG